MKIKCPLCDRMVGQRRNGRIQAHLPVEGPRGPQGGGGMVGRPQGCDASERFAHEFEVPQADLELRTRARLLATEILARKAELAKYANVNPADVSFAERATMRAGIDSQAAAAHELAEIVDRLIPEA